MAASFEPLSENIVSAARFEDVAKKKNGQETLQNLVFKVSAERILENRFQ
jgi:hypothetical protein